MKRALDQRDDFSHVELLCVKLDTEVQSESAAKNILLQPCVHVGAA